MDYYTKEKPLTLRLQSLHYSTKGKWIVQLRQEATFNNILKKSYSHQTQSFDPEPASSLDVLKHLQLVEDESRQVRAMLR